jgi:hypothetical protein
MSKVKIELSKPVEFADDVITHLELREPVGADFASFPLKSEMAAGDFVKIGMKLANQSSVVGDKLSIPDYFKVVEVVADFLNDSHQTGKN